MFDEVGKFDYINIICKCFKNIHVSISQPLTKSHSTKTHSKCCELSFGDPYGNRTHDSALRGPRLNRLTNGPAKNKTKYIMSKNKKQVFFEKYL